MTVSWEIRQGDAYDLLRKMPDQSVQTCVTSPPYYGLRDYDDTMQLGLERTPDEYVRKLAIVFDQVKRVLRDDGTLWCNLGDSYGPGKQLLGVPWRVAFALQARGWCLRSDVIWAKLAEFDAGVGDGQADEVSRVRVPVRQVAEVLLRRRRYQGAS